ncbi:MAG: DUF2185 domain-containing protein [Lachnospiraceae bacterium]|nr:DUF2185 domain-containing protein [Lachnospiraceae bacterium]
MKNIVKTIADFKTEIEQRQNHSDTEQTDRERFTLLLSGISSCRMMPGIPEHMGYEVLYHCDSPQSKELALDHMKRLFGIGDKETLLKFCYGEYSGSREYQQFMTFWSKAPLFDLKELTPDGKEGFEKCKRLAEHFYPLVKEKGFYGWDINEKIGLCRKAVACDIISEEEFWQITDEWVRQAQVFYHSFEEYAVSCLCGAVYYMGRYDSDVGGFLDINLKIVRHLLEEGAWRSFQWYTPKEREWADLLGGSNPGCLITKKALEQKNIAYMYREEPEGDVPDSGWRFFVGDESDEYVNNADNISVCGLNTICNIQPDILAFIYAEAGRKFGRDETGWTEEFI